MIIEGRDVEKRDERRQEDGDEPCRTIIHRAASLFFFLFFSYCTLWYLIELFLQGAEASFSFLSELIKINVTV